MGNCFSCCRRVDDHLDDGAPECEQPLSITLVQEKNTFVGKDNEAETTSKVENKCQPKTEHEKSTFEMQKEENQETTKVIQDNLDKEKCVEDNLDIQKDVEDNSDTKQKGESLEKPCGNEEPVQTEVNENSSSEETEDVHVANVVAKPEVDDGAEKIIQLKSGFDRNIEDQPQETGLANGAEETSELNEEDFERKSQAQIPFEKNKSSAKTNIVGESAADIQVHDEPQETELACANVQSCFRNAEFGNEDVLVDGQIVITIIEVESQDEVEENTFAAENVRIEGNVGETTFEMSASATNSSGQDNNEIEIERELGQASSAEENVPNKEEFGEDTSEGTSNEGEDSEIGEDDGNSEGETDLEEGSGDTGSA